MEDISSGMSVLTITDSDAASTEKDDNADLVELLDYSPLKASCKEIRVLSLQSGDFAHPIRCSLEHISLETASTEYIALSYSWGSKENLKAITCDGKTRYRHLKAVL